MRAPPIPPRAFGFVGTLVVVTLFSVFNLEHRSSVSFGFHTIEDVPIFITCLIAVTLGAVVMVPLFLRRRGHGEEQAAELPERGEGAKLSLPQPRGGDTETAAPATPDAMTPNAPPRAGWRPRRRAER